MWLPDTDVFCIRLRVYVKWYVSTLNTMYAAYFHFGASLYSSNRVYCPRAKHYHLYKLQVHVNLFAFNFEPKFVPNISRTLSLKSNNKKQNAFVQIEMILPLRTDDNASTMSFWLTPHKLAVSFSHFLWQFTSQSDKCGWFKQNKLFDAIKIYILETE